MKLQVVAVGRPSPLLEAAIAEYETRAGRYWSFEVVTVREERGGRNVPPALVRAAEAERILQRAEEGLELVALTREGEQLTSTAFAAQLRQAADQGRAGIVFAIGGAHGLGEAVLSAARRRLSLSRMTMPHELARLCLAEQLYRAGTIVRGEPYHKGAE